MSTTRNITGRSVWLSWAAGLAMMHGLALAQAPTTAPATEDGSSAPAAGGKAPLASKQEIVRDRMLQLEDRMFRLADKMAESEPEQAARLRKALQRSRELLVRQNMDDIARLLSSRELNEASDKERIVARDLDALLKLLMEGSVDLEKRRKEIEQMQEFRNRVASLIQEEQRHLAASQQSRQSAGLLQQIRQAVAQAEALLRREQAAIEKSETAARTHEGDGKAQAIDQAGIRVDTGKLAESVGESAATAEAAATNTGTPPSGGNTPPSGGETPPSGNTPPSGGSPPSGGERPANHTPSEHPPTATRPAATRPTATTQPASPAETAEKVGGGLRQAQDALRRAEARMNDAERPLNEGEFGAARDRQEQAAESLRRAIAELQKQAEALEKAEESRKLAELQRDTQNRTKELSRDMSGQSGGSQPNGDPSGEQQPAPGAPNVENAQQQMGRAADNLEKSQSGEAGESQQNAIDQLNEAMKQLEEYLKQLRREQQEEILRALEDRFREMLARQLRVNGGTTALDKTGVANWQRPDELQATALAQEERDLNGEASKALHILREEGTTVVFPEIVEQLATDLNDAGDRLAARDVGAGTQQLQADIVETLEQLIAAVKQMRQQMASGAGNPGGSGQQQTPPLLPDSAELKLLRECQKRVNRRTEAFNRDAGATGDLTPAQRGEIERIGDRQKQIADLAREMNERVMNQ